MAWRIDENLLRGEIDNRTRGRVTGRLWFAGRPHPVELDLEGNARLSVGEVFIGIHSHPRGAASQPSATLHASPAGSAVSSSFRKGLPNYFRKHAEAALPA